MRSDQYLMKTVGRFRVRIWPGYEDSELEALMLLDEAGLRALPNVRIVHEGRQAVVMRVERGGGRPVLYWKEFRARHWCDPLKDRVRGSKAARAWDGALKLQRVGILTAPQVAYGEEPPHGILKPSRSFIITKEIEGAQRVSDYLASFPAHPTRAELAQKRLLMRELGHTVGRMHQAELHHAGMRLSNILWRPGVSGRPRLYFLDTDRVERGSPLSEQEIARNLVQLNFFFLPGMSVSDRARMLTAYAAERLLDRRTGRRLAHRTFARLRRRLEARLRSAKEDQAPEAVVRGMTAFLKLLTPPSQAVSDGRRPA